jgi:diguanylate cyclase (GGDEF)-like protein
MPSTTAPIGAIASSHRRWLARNSALAAAEFGCAVLTLPFAGAAPFWPGAAFGVLAALLWGWGGMAGVFAGTLLANAVLLRMGWRFALMAALASSWAPMLGRALMRGLRAEVDGWWQHARGAAAYTLAMGGVMPLASALFGVGALAVFDHLPPAAAGDALLSWAVADAAAALLLAPLLQQLWQRPHAWRALRAQAAPTAAVFVLMAAVVVLLFATHALPPRDRAGLIGLMLLPAVWAIFALDAMAIVALLAFAYLALVAGVAAGWPLMPDGAAPGAQVAGISLLLLSAGAGLLLAAALQAERRTALDALARLNSELDARAERRAQALVEQERAYRARLLKLAEFRRVVSSVNQTIAQANDEHGLLQTFCDLLAGLPDLGLAWIGRPDAQQRFEVLAGAGAARAYLDGLDASADAAHATGHGLVGRSWRKQRALFDDDLELDPRLQPWRRRLHELGLRGAACLPLRRGGSPWAVLVLYASSPGGFDADWRELAVQLAGDISHGLDRVDALQREHQALRVNAALLDNLSVGVAVVRYPGRALEHVNARLLDITGAADARQLADHTDVYPDADARERAEALLERVLHDGRGTLQDLAYRRVDGATVWLDVAGVRLDFGDGAQRVLWTQIDVSQRHALTDDLGRMALFDPLTRLPNRRAIEQRLAGAIERADRHGTLLAVGMLDLDDFKPVNDRYGHATGDALLRELAARLQSRMRGSDLLGRLGGDEFVVVLEELDGARLLEQLGALLERLHGALDAAFEFDSHPPLRIGMSMGLALYPHDARDADALLRAADLAMYQTKADKGSRTRW